MEKHFGSFKFSQDVYTFQHRPSIFHGLKNVNVATFGSNKSSNLLQILPQFSIWEDALTWRTQNWRKQPIPYHRAVSICWVPVYSHLPLLQDSFKADASTSASNGKTKVQKSYYSLHSGGDQWGSNTLWFDSKVISLSFLFIFCFCSVCIYPVFLLQMGSECQLFHWAFI